MTKKEFKEGITIFLFILVLASLLFVFIIGIAQTVEYFSCNNFADLNHNHNVEYRIFGGCMVEMDDIWLSTDNVYYDTSRIVIND